MMKPSTITQWLTQPARFTDRDRKEATALVKSYPYFVPARYMEAAEQHKKQPFAAETLSSMQLYMGNWLFFHEFIETAASPAGRAAATVGRWAEDTEELEELVDEVPAGEMDHAIETIADHEPDFGAYEDEDDLTGQEDTEDEQIASEILDEESFGITEDEDIGYGTTGEDDLPEPQPAVPEIKKTEASPAKEPVATDKATAPPVKAKPADKEDDNILFYQNRKVDSLIQPIYTEDYFLHQGLHVSDKLPEDHQQKQEGKSLMVVMSFSEWLMHFKTKGEREKEEQQDQKALKTMWQKEKLAAAMEEENEEIPETVFEMAVNSITKEEDLFSEPLAEIMVRQGKFGKAIDMYRKLSLRNPQKKAYFARKIEALQKEKES